MDYVRGAAQLLAQALRRAGRTPEALAYVVATGYGRRRVPFADRETTEITCHARGVRALFPRARTVIDIGGQDVKGIKLSAAGQLVDFVMNDKCAAGTGRFLDVMARTLGLSREELAWLGLQANRPVPISSVCTVFAQHEVAQRLAEGLPLPDVLAGLHAALASRTFRLVRRLGLEPEVIVTGGGANNPLLVRALEAQLGLPVRRPPDPLVTGALGAAVLARDAVARGEVRRGPGAPGSALPDPGTSKESETLRERPLGASDEGDSVVGTFPLPPDTCRIPHPVAGVDVGTLATKAVLLTGARAWFAVLPSRGHYRASGEEALNRTLERAGLGREALTRVVGTGLGGAALGTGAPLSEVTSVAHALAVLCPGADRAIDLGAQATRLIRLRPGGGVLDFSTSGQCAASSVRLLDVVAHLLGISLAELGQRSLQARAPATFAAACAVFAETEAISLLTRGTSVDDLAAGVHRALAARIAALARAGGPCRQTALVGGGACNPGLVAELGRLLGDVVVPVDPRVVGALGAALAAVQPSVPARRT